METRWEVQVPWAYKKVGGRAAGTMVPESWGNARLAQRPKWSRYAQNAGVLPRGQTGSPIRG